MKHPPPVADDAVIARIRSLRRNAEEILRTNGLATAASLDALSPEEAGRVIHDLHVHQIELELQNEELREAQAALDAARARYFDLYDLAPVGYFTLDRDGAIIEANLTGATMLGTSRNVMVGQPFGRFVVAADADSFYLHVKELLRSGMRQAFELGLLGASGKPFAAAIEAAPLSSADPARGCRFVVSDISARKVTEEKLRYSQRLLQAASRMSRIGGWAIRLPQQRLEWSSESAAVLDFLPDTNPSLPQALSRFVPASRLVLSQALELCARQGLPFDLELEARNMRDGAIHVRAIGQAVRDASGAIVGMEGALQDITARTKADRANALLEAQLRESQKMEAIGTLAGGVAHDLNNILGNILGNTELARQDSSENWQALVSLDEIRKAGHRGRDLVEQILAFSRRQPTSRRVMSLAPVVKEAVRLLRAGTPAAVRIECRIEADAPSILADPTQVQQAILNIGTNAAHATGDHGGAIDVIVEAVALDEAAAGSVPGLKAGRHARVTIADTGHGMDAATLRRIFEPFFTTKDKGTGLGLSVVHGIMHAHRGAIVARSEPGKGSTFELYFPVAPNVATSLPATEPAERASEGNGRHVLYIEDDEAQLFLVKRMLERWGYRVSAYLEQREALDWLLAGPERADLVITDFNMPGLSGVEVARAIHGARPDLPVVIVSGYITDELRAQAAAAGVSEVLAKTQEVEELRDILQRLLASRMAAKTDPA